MKAVFFFVALSLTGSAFAQDSNTCEVAVLPITGQYTGECKSNKAHGKGKSVGMDTYEGEFKKGYPDGEGTYTWKNGNFFTGSFKKGIKQGMGEMHFLRPGITDSVVVGYWEKDLYKGKNAKPYNIVTTTTDVGRVAVTNMTPKDRSITVTVQSLANTKDIYSSNNVQTRMTDVQVTRGSYIGKASNMLADKEVTVFQQVIFPFRATFRFGNSLVEIEIFDDGGWDIYVPTGR